MGNGDLVRGVFPPTGPAPHAICFALEPSSQPEKSLSESDTYSNIAN